ncbi:Calx-beta domain-containing protein [Humitalea sp. 24SJ18S-53]|uniref:Calx-beta domain-containing protein n=1 Tax=Humitalea sp. 24SJ18S-53 TaxID=3422307 RepID=UPI003D6679E9
MSDFAGFEMAFCPDGGCVGCGGCSTQMRDYIEKSDAYKNDPAIKNSEYNPTTAPHEVASLLYEGWAAAYWTGGKLATPTVVTYSFATTASNYQGLVTGASWNTTGEMFEYWQSIKIAIDAAAATHSAATGIELVYVDDPTKADINWRFETATTEQPGAVWAPGPTDLSGDIWINGKFFDFYKKMDFRPGNEGFQFLLHEFGHAIGMNHPFAGKFLLPAYQENRAYTVMSHTLDPLGAISIAGLRPLDINALGYIYGTQEEQDSAPVKWRQMAGSEGGLVSTGGDGDERIVGIGGRDWQIAGAGDDTLSGGQGNDILDAGTGQNIVLGGQGVDTIVFDHKFTSGGYSLNYRPNTIQLNDDGGQEGMLQSDDTFIHFTGVEKVRFLDGVLDLQTNTFTRSDITTQIDGMFRLALGRAATDQELKRFGEAMDLEGISAKAVFADIVKSDEWAARNASLTPGELGDRLFQIVYGHNSPSSSADSYKPFLTSVDGIAAVLNTLNESMVWRASLGLKPIIALNVDHTPSSGHVFLGHQTPQTMVGTALDDYFLARGGDKIQAGAGSDTLGLSAWWQGADAALALESATSTGGRSGTVRTSTGELTFKEIEKIAYLDGDLVFGRSELAAQVTRIYLTTTGKAPDTFVLSQVIKQINTGTYSTLELAQDLVQSNAFKSFIGDIVGITEADAASRRPVLIENLWKSATGTQPALSEWVAILKVHGNGLTGWLVDYLASSEAGRAKWAPITDLGVFVLDETASKINGLYQIIFGISANRDDLAEMTARVRFGGESLADLTAGLLIQPGSIAYGIDNASFVAAVTARIYGASLSGDALTNLAGWLDDGSLTKAEFISSLSYQTLGFAGTMSGSSASDLVVGGRLDDYIQGYAGDDVLIGGAGADTLDGGSNVDWASYETSNSSIKASLGDASINTGDASGDSYVSIENLRGSLYGDWLGGDRLDNRLEGGYGDDTLTGGAGGDVLDGGAGSDIASYVDSATGVKASLSALAGDTGDAAGDKYISIENLEGSSFNDWLTGDGQNNNLYGLSGDDRLEGGAGDDTLYGGAGADKLDGGSGRDVASYETSELGIFASLAKPSDNTGDAAGDVYIGIEILRGSRFADTLVGSAAADRLEGGNGDDLLIGGAGADQLSGGGGIDTVSYETASEGITVSLAKSSINTGDAAGDVYASIENVRGSRFNDNIFGATRSEVIDGGDGNDYIYSDSGDDTIIGSSGNDTIDGGAGIDTIVYNFASTSSSWIKFPDGHYEITKGSWKDVVDGVEFIRFSDGILDLSNNTFKKGQLAQLSVAVANSTTSEGQSGSTPFTFTVNRIGDLSADHSATWSVAGIGANPASASDFLEGVLPSGLVSFAVGETSKTITVNLVGDTLVEANEDFELLLSNPSIWASITKAAAAGSILNDDATLSMATSSASNSEGQSGITPFTFVVNRAGDLSVEHHATWFVIGSGTNAANASDFLGGDLPRGLVTFKVGESSKTITVNVVGDTHVEANEGFNITLTAPSSGVRIGTASSNATIINDDLAILSSSSTVDAAEGNSGSTLFNFTVTRGGNTSGTASANWTVSPTSGSTLVAADFVDAVLPTGTVTFAAGETIKTVSVNVVGDAAVEADESFNFTLSSPTVGTVLSINRATGTIINDDVAAPAPVPHSGGDEPNGGTSFDAPYFNIAPWMLKIRDLGHGFLSVQAESFDNRTLIGRESITTQDGTVQLLPDLGGLFRASTVDDNYFLLGSSYVGPVAGLERQLLGSDASDVFAGTSGNDFMNLGSGDDAANGGAGNDVIDGGLGSNFLSGGAGQDTFFADGRGGGVTWTTIADWEVGEQLSIWGWQPGASRITWVDSDGVGDFKGVTMRADLNGDGEIETSVTWSGKSAADVPAPFEFDGLLWFIG